MKAKESILIILIVLIFSIPSLSQGWKEITPPGLVWVQGFEGFDFADGNFEVYVWDQQGYKMTRGFQWDSVLASQSYFCGVYEGYVYENYFQLITLNKAYTNPDVTFSVFVEAGGCLVECITWLYSDGTGNISVNNPVMSFDDFLCMGVYSSVAISPFNENDIYFTFYDSLYYSSDKGSKFQAISTPDSSPYSPMLQGLYLSPIDPMTIFVRGFEQTRESYFLYKSTDRGYSWKSVLDQPINQIEFQPMNSSTAYVASDSGIYRSADHGETWSRVLGGSFLSIEVDKDYAERIFSGNFEGDLYESLDGGNRWHIYNNTFTSSWIKGIYKPVQSDTLIVAAIDGVFKVYESFVVGVHSEPVELVQRFMLHQNYPNPFNPSTTIRYELPRRAHVVLKIYNVLGEEVRALVDEEKEAGGYEVTWNAERFASGVYFYQLHAGEFTETRKLAFVR